MSLYSYFRISKPSPEKVPAERVKSISSEFKAMLTDMERVFGTKVRASGNDKKGKIVIDYYSAADLQRIYDLIERLKEEE